MQRNVETRLKNIFTLNICVNCFRLCGSWHSKSPTKSQTQYPKQKYANTHTHLIGHPSGDVSDVMGVQN